MIYQNREIDNKRLFDELGLEGSETGHNLYTKCPFHDDSNPSFSIHTVTGLSICFRGCFTGNLEQLVERMMGFTPLRAQQWLLGLAEMPKPSSLMKLLHPEEKAEKPVEVVDEGRMVEGACPDWFKGRGFDIADIKLWGIKYEPHTHSIVIPTFNGFIRRYPPGNPMRYQNSEGLNRTNDVFGYYRIVKSSIKIKQLLVTEGAINAMWAVKNGLDAVAILGSSISPSQILRIGMLHPEEIVLAFDNDEAGFKVTRQAAKEMNGFNLSYMNLPDGINDLNDLNPQELQETFEKRLPVLTAKLRKIGAFSGGTQKHQR